MKFCYILVHHVFLKIKKKERQQYRKGRRIRQHHPRGERSTTPKKDGKATPPKAAPHKRRGGGRQHRSKEQGRTNTFPEFNSLYSNLFLIQKFVILLKCNFISSKKGERQHHAEEAEGGARGATHWKRDQAAAPKKGVEEKGKHHQPQGRTGWRKAAPPPKRTRRNNNPLPTNKDRGTTTLP